MSVFIPLTRETACKPVIISVAELTLFPKCVGKGCAALFWCKNICSQVNLGLNKVNGLFLGISYLNTVLLY